MGDGHEFKRLPGLEGEPPLTDSRARRTRLAPVRTIRKRCYAAVGQGQMTVGQYLEGFKAESTARGG